MLTGGGRTYNWNVDNKPSGIVGPGSMATAESYTYGAEGERVSRTRGATTTVYLAGGIWEETVGSGGERRLLHNFGGQVVAQRSSSGSFIYLNSDHLGSASVTTDASGNNAQHQEFDPWGKVRSGGLISQTSINYTGQRLDDGTGLMYYNARYYDPGIGRFTSPDSIIPKKENPQAFNRYGYAYNNPIKLKDATGHRPEEYDGASSDGGSSEAGSSDLPSVDESPQKDQQQEERNWRENPYQGDKYLDDEAREHITDHHPDPNDPNNPERFPNNGNWDPFSIETAGEDIANDPHLPSLPNPTGDPDTKIKIGVRDDVWISVPYVDNPDRVDDGRIITVFPNTGKNKPNNTEQFFSIAASQPNGSLVTKPINLPIPIHY